KAAESIHGLVDELFVRAVIAHIHCAHRSVPAHLLLQLEAPFVITGNRRLGGVEEAKLRRVRTAARKIRFEGGICRRCQAVQAVGRLWSQSAVKLREERNCWCLIQDAVDRSGWK